MRLLIWLICWFVVALIWLVLNVGCGKGCDCVFDFAVDRYILI